MTGFVNDFVIFLTFSFYFLAFYFLVCSVSWIISLWKIFEKEKINSYYSLIPFVNVYYYFKICKLPFWTIIVPIINLITLYCSGYIITKKYRCKKWQSILAIFFPFVMLPYIAFSNKTNIDIAIEERYVKNASEIDALESMLQKNSGLELDEEFVNTDVQNTENYNSSLISAIENEIIQDDFVYDEHQEVESQFSPVDLEVNEFKELDDDLNVNDLSISDMEKLEENMISENSIEKNISKDIKDYKEFKPSDEAIAFGGDKQIENINAVQTKNDYLKCSRCGSSLVGSNGICPGCGAKIEDVT